MTRTPYASRDDPEKGSMDRDKNREAWCQFEIEGRRHHGPLPHISKLNAGGNDARKAATISINYYRQPPTLRWGAPGVVVGIEVAMLGCCRNLKCYMCSRFLSLAMDSDNSTGRWRGHLTFSWTTSAEATACVEVMHGADARLANCGIRASLLFFH